ncbi:hypothetical protein [Flectobacillus longus]|uniref:hypothetical protein n=1 Tax=Flectobacillus longus TaxID=2984207 RepID=UPI0024B7F512|nr:hypothetical protein [Flectobacillus longus]MDI9878918.1 hypothetical protein [Flectobacillus longus]
MANVPLVAIVATTKRISFNEVQKATKAIDFQIKNHVSKYWDKQIYFGLQASIVCYESIQQVPYGSWLVTIDEQIDTDSYGYHYVTEQNETYAPKGTPYARIRYDRIWSLILSHEVTELLINPYLQNFRYADIGGKKVRLVVEPSDPAQFRDYGYLIDDVLVSDFTTPNYYDLVWTPNTQYSFTGQIKKPLELLENGYFSFQYLDRLDVWWQMWKVKGQIVTRNISEVATQNKSYTVVAIILIILLLFLYNGRK